VFLRELDTVEMLQNALRNYGVPLAIRDLLLAVAVIVLGATGTFLLLPHRHGSVKPRRVHAAGGALVGLSILLLACFWTPPGSFQANLFFYAFGMAAVAGGILTITSRNPIYSALWFASVVLSTSGLFLLAGAQFLAAGTVIVYAGAIIVTFLFVIMLAQSQGQALYDRMARAPGRATLSCFLLLWGLMYALLVAQTIPLGQGQDSLAREKRLVRASQIVGFYRIQPSTNPAMVLNRANRPTSQLPQSQQSHVAGLGGTLYTDHLIAAELAGVLLFVALVGAVAIALPRVPGRPAGPPTAP